MKRRLLALLFIPCILLSLAVSIVHPSVASAASITRQQASDACNNASLDLGQQAPFCADGYLAGYQGLPPPAGCGTVTTNACAPGYALGVKDAGGKSNNGTPTPPSKVPSDVQTKAFNYCNGDSSVTESDCQTGYEWAYTTGKRPASCNTSCAVGFAHGITDLQTNAPSLCQSYGTGTNAFLDIQACQQGVEAKLSSQPDPCGSLSDTKKEKTACENGYTNTVAPATTSASSTPPCEASGVSLSWLFCPIINGLAQASDEIYTNIIQPLLKTDPINLSNPQNDPSHTYQIWSEFRVFGDIFLVIALLVVVFGESIGGGLIDAYAAKKILPRLLIAAILINLSLYLVALAVDLTNVIGNGIGALIELPFKSAACTSASNLGTGTPCFALHINGSTGDLGMAALVGGGIWAALSAGPLFEFILLFFLIPAFLTMLAILVTVFLRRGLILFLILVSPIAFALYCLPNTEKYFRQWWDLLLKTLLVYPLIAVIFALSNVLSVTIDKSSTGGLKTIADFLAIVALFVPLFLIPFAFRISGGILGRFHEFTTQSRKQASEAIKGNPNDQFSWRNMTKRKLGNRTLAQRESVVGKGIDMQKNRRSAIGRAVGGGLATVAGFGNYQQRRSIRNREAADYIQAQTSTGNDSSVRSMFARQLSYVDANGRQQKGWFGVGAKVGADGNVIGVNQPQFSEFEVKKARGLMARDASFYQAGLTYEIGKAGDDSELDTIRAVNADNIKASPWLRQESVGIVKGAGFSHSQTRREMKHEDLDVDSGTYSRNSRASSREIAENVSNWGISNMRTSTLKAEQADYRAARAYLALQPNSGASAADISRAQQDMAEIRTYKVQPKIGSADEAREIMQHVESTANSLDMRRQQTGSFAIAGEGDNQSPIGGAQTGAPGHVNEEIEKLIGLAATTRRGNGGSTTTGPSGGIASPGSAGFNIPPGGRPGGPNFR